MPGTSAWRTSRIVTRRPVLQRNTFHTTLTMTSRQKATSTPGDSARLTSVELSEKATTTPTTASTPNVRALTDRRRALDDADGAAIDEAYSGHYADVFEHRMCSGRRHWQELPAPHGHRRALGGRHVLVQVRCADTQGTEPCTRPSLHPERLDAGS